MDLFSARIKGVGTLALASLGEGDEIVLRLDRRLAASFDRPEAEGWGNGRERYYDNLQALMRNPEVEPRTTVPQRREMRKARKLHKPLRHALRALLDRDERVSHVGYVWKTPETVDICISLAGFNADPAGSTKWLAKRLNELVEEFS